VDNLKAAIAERSAEVTWDQSLPEVAADPGLLVQVLQNLIANGIKFQKDGTAPQVHVSVAGQGSEWVFSIRDNGIGIDPRHSGRIFRIFERLNASDQYPGTGMGLAIAQKIIERHGGRIWFDSNPGEGSAFYFAIPRIS
jgi:light-regulated signal transduction histidine kinase (bacteriophytochrome)